MEDTKADFAINNFKKIQKQRKTGFHGLNNKHKTRVIGLEGLKIKLKKRQKC